MLHRIVILVVQLFIVGEVHAQAGTVSVPSWDGKAKGGDPVDLKTGIYERSSVDIKFYGALPIIFTRQYRNQDPVSRAFGIGTSQSFDWFLQPDNRTFTYVDLFLEDGRRIRFIRNSPGTGFQSAKFAHVFSPTRFYDSALSLDGNRWVLTLVDGSVYSFLTCGADHVPKCSLIAYQDKKGGKIEMTRDEKGNLLSVTKSGGRGISFRNDSKGRIQEAKAIGTSKAVRYKYDAEGRLTGVEGPGIQVYDGFPNKLYFFRKLFGFSDYEPTDWIEYSYDIAHNMTGMKDSTGFELVNIYDSNHRVINQRLKDGRQWSFVYKLDRQGKVLQTEENDPAGTTRRVTFDSTGYAVTETYPLGEHDELSWTYERDPISKRLVAMAVECLSTNNQKLRLRETIGPGRSGDNVERQFLARCKSFTR